MGELLNTSTGKVEENIQNQKVDNPVVTETSGTEETPVAAPSFDERMNSFDEALNTGDVVYESGLESQDISNVNSDFIKGIYEDTSQVANNISAEEQSFGGKLIKTLGGGVSDGVISAIDPLFQFAGYMNGVLGGDMEEQIAGLGEQLKEEIGPDVFEKELGPDADWIDMFTQWQTLRSITESAVQFGAYGALAGMGVSALGRTALNLGSKVNRISKGSEMAKTIASGLNVAGRHLSNPIPIKGLNNKFLGNIFNSQALTTSLATSSLEGLVMAKEIDKDMRQQYANILYDPNASPALRDMINGEISQAKWQMAGMNAATLMTDLIGLNKLTSSFKRGLGKKVPLAIKRGEGIFSGMGLMSVTEGAEEIYQSLISNTAAKGSGLDIERKYMNLDDKDKYKADAGKSFILKPEDYLLWRSDPEAAKELTAYNAESVIGALTQHATTNEAIVEGLSGFFGGGPQWIVTRAPSHIKNYNRNREAKAERGNFFRTVADKFQGSTADKAKNDLAFTSILEDMDIKVPEGADNEYLHEAASDYATKSAMIESLQRGYGDNMSEFFTEQRVALKNAKDSGDITSEAYNKKNAKIDSYENLSDEYSDLAHYANSNDLFTVAANIEALKSSKDVIRGAKDQVLRNSAENKQKLVTELNELQTDPEANKERIAEINTEIAQVENLDTLNKIDASVSENLSNEQARMKQLQSPQAQIKALENMDKINALNTEVNTLLQSNDVDLITNRIREYKDLAKSDKQLSLTYLQSAAQLAMKLDRIRDAEDNTNVESNTATQTPPTQTPPPAPTTSSVIGDTDNEPKGSKADSIKNMFANQVVEAEPEPTPPPTPTASEPGTSKADLIKGAFANQVSSEGGDTEFDPQLMQVIEDIATELTGELAAENTNMPELRKEFTEASKVVQNMANTDVDELNDKRSDGYLNLKNKFPNVFSLVNKTYAAMESELPLYGLDTTFDGVLGTVAIVTESNQPEIAAAVKAAYIQYDDTISFQTVQSNVKPGTTVAEVESDPETIPDVVISTTASLHLGGYAMAWDSDIAADYKNLRKGTGIQYEIMSDEDMANRFTIDVNGNKKEVPTKVSVRLGANNIAYPSWTEFSAMREEALALPPDANLELVSPSVKAIAEAFRDGSTMYTDAAIRPIRIKATSGLHKGKPIGFVRNEEWASRPKLNKDGTPYPQNIIDANTKQVAEMREVIFEAAKMGNDLKGKITSRAENLKLQQDNLYSGTALKISDRNVRRQAKTILGKDQRLLFSVVEQDLNTKKTQLNEFVMGALQKQKAMDGLRVRGQEGVALPNYIKPGSTVVVLPMEGQLAHTAQVLEAPRLSKKYKDTLNELMSLVIQGSNRLSPSGFRQRMSSLVNVSHKKEAGATNHFKFRVDTAADGITMSVFLDNSVHEIQIASTSFNDRDYYHEVKGVKTSSITGKVRNEITGQAAIDEATELLNLVKNASDEQTPYLNIDRERLQEYYNPSKEYPLKAYKENEAGALEYVEVDYVNDVVLEHTMTNLDAPTELPGGQFSYVTNTVMTTALNTTGKMQAALEARTAAMAKNQASIAAKNNELKESIQRADNQISALRNVQTLQNMKLSEENIEEKLGANLPIIQKALGVKDNVELLEKINSIKNIDENIRELERLKEDLQSGLSENKSDNTDPLEAFGDLTGMIDLFSKSVEEEVNPDASSGDTETPVTNYEAKTVAEGITLNTLYSTVNVDTPFGTFVSDLVSAGYITINKEDGTPC